MQTLRMVFSLLCHLLMVAAPVYYIINARRSSAPVVLMMVGAILEAVISFYLIGNVRRSFAWLGDLADDFYFWLGAARGIASLLFACGFALFISETFKRPTPGSQNF